MTLERYRRSRRRLPRSAALTSVGVGARLRLTSLVTAQTPEALPEELVVDMEGGPDNLDVMQAISANLADMGISVSIESTELAKVNGSWQVPDSAPLRFVTWRPVYDPHTLLGLMFASTGPLSRFADESTDALIAAAATEAAFEQRVEKYRQLGRQFQESPPAVFLWNLTAIYGIKDFGDGWSPRGDEYIIPTRTEKIQ